MDLQGFATGQLMLAVLVFARLGTALAFLPGFGEAQVPVRMRLCLALLAALALAPATPVPPVEPESLVVVARLLFTETLVGLWIGLCARLLLSALHFAGSQIGTTIGLANAFAPSLGGFEGATAIAGFLTVGCVAAIFATDVHHEMIRALIRSYDLLPFAEIVPGDLAREMTRIAGGSFRIGVTLAAPFFVLGLLLNLALGLANRMLPSLPVFMLAAPGLIAVGFLVLDAASPAILQGFAGIFGDWIGRLVW